MMRTKFSFRVRLISVLILLFAGLLVSRLYFLQVVEGEEYSVRADRQYVRPNQNLFDRGSIFFQDRNKPLFSASRIKTGFTIAINPSILEDPDAAYAALTEILPINRDTFFLRAGKVDDPYEEIAKEVEKKLAEKVEELAIIGVDIYREQWRYNPGETLAAQALGFVGYDGDGLSGRYGLERYYDDVLARQESGAYVNFFAQIFSNLGDTLFEGKRGKEGDIITTIELSVQLELEKHLKEIQSEWNSRISGGVIMDPQTGAIYALGVNPTFDVNHFEDVDDPHVFVNPIVERVYEMGSIIKPLTMAAGIDSGAITPQTTYNDEGYIILDGARISNYDGVGRGVVPMQEVLSQSLNTGVSFIVGEMGNETFAQYMRDLGLGEKTGIDLPNETAGLLSNLNSPRDLEYATASFGQGVAYSPIGTVRALATLGNGGVLLTPHLVSKIKYRSGLSETIEPEDGRQVFAPETAEEVTRMLVEVVDSALLDGTVKLDRYSVAAKTGTAQIAKEGARGYYDDRFLHSFFGYFPAYDPQFIIFLYTVEPEGARYASQTLTHPFIDTVEFLINHYDIPPDR